MGLISFVVQRICSKFVKTPTPRDYVEFPFWFEIAYSHIGSFFPPPLHLVLPSFRPCHRRQCQCHFIAPKVAKLGRVRPQPQQRAATATSPPTASAYTRS